MTAAPVGLRCPEHAGSRKVVKPPRIVRRAPRGASDALVTRTLIGPLSALAAAVIYFELKRIRGEPVPGQEATTAPAQPAAPAQPEAPTQPVTPPAQPTAPRQVPPQQPPQQS